MRYFLKIFFQPDKKRLILENLYADFPKNFVTLLNGVKRCLTEQMKNLWLKNETSCRTVFSRLMPINGYMDYIFIRVFFLTFDLS